jgi:penicillin-binding protein 2
MHRAYEMGGLEQRAKAANAILLLAFLFIIIVLARFQLLKSTEYKLKSDENRLRVVPLLPPRGVITDRGDRLLVDNRPHYSLSLYPGSKELLLRELSVLQQIFPDETIDSEKVFRRARAAPGQPVRILERVSSEALAVVEEHRERLPGLKIQSEAFRTYPYAGDFAHFLGYVGEVTQREVEKVGPVKYRTGDYVGRTGIESGFDGSLRGRWGASYIEVDALGRELGLFKAKKIEKPVAGENLRLTVDLDLQLAVAALFPMEKKGAVVCLDPRDGSILALYSSPSFDPNALTRGVSSEDWKAISGNPDSPLLNRAIQAAYPPGSTFKPVTALAAMEEGLFETGEPEATCYGSMQFGTRRFRCWKEEGHGHLAFLQGLAQSCDVYFYKLGVRVGLEALTRDAIQLGFGSATGVDLPGEAAGLMPTPAWYDRTYGPSNWGRGVIMNLAIGQGEILATPLQLARLYAAIANGGWLVTPHVRFQGGRERKTPLQIGDKEGLALLRSALFEVVNGPRGTGKLAAPRSGVVLVSGKTGTAENPHGDDHALFIGYAPSENPEIVCVVVVEESGHGGSVAAPVVAAIFERYYSPADSLSQEGLEHVDKNTTIHRET